MSKKKIKKLEQKGYDFHFIKETQPKGNITFQESDWYWHNGSCYGALMTVTGFPQNGLGLFWAKEVMKINNTISFMHMETIDNNDMQEELKSNISEKGSRLGTGRTQTDNNKEYDEYLELNEMESAIRKYSIPTKGISVRLIVTGKTPDGLSAEIERVKNECPRFEFSLFLGEHELDYHAPFIPADRLQDTPNARKPQPLLVTALGASFWGDHTKLEDKYGVYFGTTTTGGVVNFDLLTRNSIRKRPNMIISGSSNMGQKTLFVKNADVLFSKGHKLLNIDLDNTFCSPLNSDSALPRINEKQFGVRVDMSGVHSEYVLNIMQVLPTVTKPNGIEVDEISSFARHIDAIASFAQAISPTLNNIAIQKLKTVVKEFYIKYNYWYLNPEDHEKDDDFGITNLFETEYPLLSDFITYLKLRLEQAKKTSSDSNGDVDTTTMQDLYTTFLDLKNRYPIFEGHTTFTNFENEDVITFDLSNIEDTNLMNLQLIQTLRFFQMLVVTNGKVENLRYEKDLKESGYAEKEQYRHTVINISSADKILDERNTQSILYLSDILKSIGRNFGAMILEMGSLQNILVANNSGTNDFSNAIRKVFEFTQYRVFAQTDESAIPHIAQTLGSLRESELQNIPRLSEDTFLLNISGGMNLVFQQDFSDFELERYKYLVNL